MARRVVAECDIDGRPDAREWVIITPEGGRCRIDLCDEEHGALIRDMLRHGRDDPAGGPSPAPMQARRLERLVRNVPPMPEGSG